MTSSLPKPRVKVRLSSAAEVLEALRAQDEGLRFTLCQTLAQKPEKALAYDAECCGELRRELVKLLAKSASPLHRHLVLTALYAFPVGDIFWEEFQAAGEVETLMLLAQRLKAEPALWLIPKLVALFRDDTDSNRRQVVANMLASQSSLPPEVELDVAILGLGELRQPSLDRELWPRWLGHLRGAQAQKARALLRNHPQAGALLSVEWKTLQQEERAWACGWLPLDETLVMRALSSAGLLAVLAARLRTHPEPARFLPLLEPQWNESDEELRVALLACGVRPRNLMRAYEKAETSALKVALLEFWPQTSPWEISLTDKDWRVRAAATNRLRSLRPQLETLHRWASSHNEFLQIAAASLLQN